MDLISSPENWTALLTLSWKIVGRWCRAGIGPAKFEVCSRWPTQFPGRRFGSSAIIKLNQRITVVVRSSKIAGFCPKFEKRLRRGANLSTVCASSSAVRQQRGQTPKSQGLLIPTPSRHFAYFLPILCIGDSALPVLAA
jgi:hypothetical protein